MQTGGFSDGGNHPCHLGVDRFGGGWWEAYLAGVGLKGLGNRLFTGSRRPAGDDPAAQVPSLARDRSLGHPQVKVGR